MISDREARIYIYNKTNDFLETMTEDDLAREYVRDRVCRMLFERRYPLRDLENFEDWVDRFVYISTRRSIYSYYRKGSANREKDSLTSVRDKSYSVDFDKDIDVMNIYKRLKKKVSKMPQLEGKRSKAQALQVIEDHYGYGYKYYEALEKQGYSRTTRISNIMKRFNGDFSEEKKMYDEINIL